MNFSKPSPEVTQQHVTRIAVRKLFGYLDYNIPPKEYDSMYDDLLILYGDNGCGKTTILRMLFNLLSTQPGGGRKTSLATTPFERFEVHFSGGSNVIVDKESGQLRGGYRVSIVGPDDQRESFPLTCGPDGGIKPDGNPIQELYHSIARLGVSLYFLPDDRRVQAELSGDAPAPRGTA